MVTTFSARLVSLTNKCNSIIGKRKSFDIDSIDINNTQNHQMHNYSAMKRQGTFDTEPRRHHRNHHHSDCPDHKRRKQKEDLQYTAATIQSALQAAGRPPMSILERRRERALPLGCVDMNAAKVIYSSEYDKQKGPFFDEEQKEYVTGSSKSAKDASVNAIEDSSNLISQEFASSTNLDDVAYEDLDYASLIVSTRTYYKNNFRSPPTSNFTVSNTKVTQSKNVNNDVDKNSDSSEGVSSWTPSSHSNDLKIYKKNIDNDNRSDDVSSVAAEESSSESSLCQSPLSPTALKEDIFNESEGNGIRNRSAASAFTVVG
eukprot:CAMPEP_0171332024 /NCGR_PEP_ID=MMETSP0878-20121228/3108_1 /TAXON_ID=67004 /ORGANISM="Thalassiosira weissflogii, Strain CCMP1336" /LENGTH=315 /DNA_ID=CAMNT_0011832703 /DNA_START=70 /DNA_END=1017 /DNA_ORIENTATION=+